MCFFVFVFIFFLIEFFFVSNVWMWVKFLIRRVFFVFFRARSVVFSVCFFFVFNLCLWVSFLCFKCVCLVFFVLMCCFFVFFVWRWVCLMRSVSAASRRVSVFLTRWCFVFCFVFCLVIWCCCFVFLVFLCLWMSFLVFLCFVILNGEMYFISARSRVFFIKVTTALMFLDVSVMFDVGLDKNLWLVLLRYDVRFMLLFVYDLSFVWRGLWMFFAISFETTF